ncbi:MAG: CocE/NonD family hydrolase [Acidobacteriota bacterium]|nr:CocE/NonD family hydrolase [Acidobacteriota bacterium]
MRDGITLSADMWMPEPEGRYPAILIRTPYVKVSKYLAPLGAIFAPEGYVLIIQDVRGRGDSEGEFGFYFVEGRDGYDSIEWIAAQPWCDGNVGMMGSSYAAAVQWLAAREQPPHLKCIVPTAASAVYFEEFPYTGGAWAMQWALGWLNGTSGRVAQGGNLVGIDWEKLFWHRPLLTMDEAMGRNMKFYKEWLTHSTLDDYWKRIHFTVEDFQNIDIPALTVTGWFDVDQPGALTYWTHMRKHSPGKDKMNLIIGPWNHGETFFGGDTKEGELTFTKDSVLDMMGLHLRFFNHHLKGSAPDFNPPRARVYSTGMNIWREFDEYPPADMTFQKLYLRSGGQANTLLGDGTLSWNEPGMEPPDKYIFDPKDPIRMDKMPSSGYTDNRLIQIRKDVLVYTGERLSEPVDILGPVKAELFISSDAKDTDFIVKLLDVFPDGRAIELGRYGMGIKRARYRFGYEKEVLLTPGKTEKITIDLFDIGHTFLAGHKIRVEISSSAFPWINPNQNTGNPVATDKEWKTAHQTVFHDKTYPSHVILPIMPLKK